MSEIEKDYTLKSILQNAVKSGERLRFYGPGMMIVAEGTVALVGKDVVAIKHSNKEEPDEFVNLECIIKVQILGEYRQY
ncbi:hypothetical protein EU527_07750 [Candidatus Thorarchaeota archaeon]|nr:MAG: hypothetical protein EU527_07750 [Candidatus Thorarchaeota archaeon]